LLALTPIRLQLLILGARSLMHHHPRQGLAIALLAKFAAKLGALHH